MLHASSVSFHIRHRGVRYLEKLIYYPADVNRFFQSCIC